MRAGGQGRRAGWVLAVGLVSAAAGPACSSPSKGALVLAISTDMQAPKDIDLVSVFVSTNGVRKFDYIGRVLPDGTVSLPSTLAIVQPDDPTAQVRIRVTAFKTQATGEATALVLRDILTTVPDTTVLLRVPLSFLDSGSASGTLPATLVPSATTGVPEGDTTYDPTSTSPSAQGHLQASCPAGQTSVAGSCASATQSSSSLPAYSPSTVFGPGGDQANPACFDVKGCLAQPQTVTGVDMASCSFSIPAGEDGQNWNCALVTPDGTGLCSGGKCLVPLDQDPIFGFTIEKGVAIRMVPGVCKKLMAGAVLWVDKTSCATKAPSNPLCQRPSTGGADGGAPSDGSAGDSSLDGGHE